MTTPRKKNVQNKNANNTEKESLFMLISQASYLWQNEIDTKLKKYNLTNNEFLLLSGVAWLTKDEKYPMQMDVCKYTNMKPMNVSILFRKLQKLNYITRQEHDVDTRAKAILLTDFGMQTLNEINALLDSFNLNFFDLTKDKEIEFSKRILELISSNK